MADKYCIALLLGMLAWGCTVSAPKPQVLVLGGWAQDPKGLDAIVPEGAEITHVDYHRLKGKDAVFDALRKLPHAPDIVIGWSMGGRLAVNAVAGDVVKPKLLVLISTSSRSIRDSLDVAAFQKAFAENPEQLRENFITKMLAGDGRAKDIRRALESRMEPIDQDWVEWLSTTFHSRDLDYSAMPRTLLIYGENDAFVKREEAEFFRRKIPHARYHLLRDSGHAPHAHAPEAIQETIEEEMPGPSKK